MILHLANESDGIHFNGWVFGGGTRAPFGYITNGLSLPTEPVIGIWVHLYVGDGTMALLVLACQTLLWWPLNPMGYPIAKIWLIDSLWISIFLA